MIYPSIDVLLEKFDSKYTLVIVEMAVVKLSLKTTVKRLRQLCVKLKLAILSMKEFVMASSRRPFR